MAATKRNAVVTESFMTVNSRCRLRIKFVLSKLHWNLVGFYMKITCPLCLPFGCLRQLSRLDPFYVQVRIL